jgi:hypothetical protein
MRFAADQGRNPPLRILYEAWSTRSRRKNSQKDNLLKFVLKLNPDLTESEARFIAQAMAAQDVLGDQGTKQLESKRRMLARKPFPSRNTFILGFENLPLMPDRQARPRSSAPGSRAATTDSGGGGPDEPDPDPDPERPYIALGIDHKATTPAGPPVPVSLRLSLYRIEMRYCHDGNKPDHPEP